MQQKELFFVIPTYRLREVGDTVKAYDDHFWRNGHSVPMVVFDDSSPVWTVESLDMTTPCGCRRESPQGVLCIRA